MATIVNDTDLPEAVRSALDPGLLASMIAGVNARASRVAPCLNEDEEGNPPAGELVAEAKLVLIGAIRRWADSGSGAFQQQTTGPFGVTVDTRQRTGYNLWPSEIAQLQDLCAAARESSGAYSVDTVPTAGPLVHADICSIHFGSEFCSCGAVLTQGLPLYENYPGT